jgi:hypothetical protein
MLHLLQIFYGLAHELACRFKVLKLYTDVSEMNAYQKTNKLRGLIPRANYTDRATAACRRS